MTGKLDANRPVPFRLTPNLAEFLTPVGVNGVVSAAIVSAARCLAEPHFSIQSILRAVLRDEMIAWHKKVSFHGDRSSQKKKKPLYIPCSLSQVFKEYLEGLNE